MVPITRRPALFALLCVLGCAPVCRPAAAAGRVCVVDLNNCAPVGGAALGRQAARALSAALSRPDGPPVLADAELLRCLESLRLAPPLDRSARSRVAEQLGAGEVVFGTITAARVTGASPATASVRMIVVVEDARTGTVLRAGSVEGSATEEPGAGRHPETLLERAVERAAARFAAGETGGAAPAPVVRLATAGRPALPAAAAPDPAPARVAVVTAWPDEARRLQPPPPVVIDTPGLDRARSHTPSLLSTRTLRLLAGGLEFLALVW